MSEDRKSHEPRPSYTEPESSIFEKVMPEGLKRGLKQFMGDFKLPKEIVSHLMAQIDETKHAALGVVSREVRLFLEHTNLSEELAKLLTQISFEVSTQVRFVPSDKAIKRKKKRPDPRHAQSHPSEEEEEDLEQEEQAPAPSEEHEEESKTDQGI